MLLILLAVVGYGAYYYANLMPTPDDLRLDLGLEELQITADPGRLLSGPGEGGEIAQLAKDSRVKLRAKRGDYYFVEDPASGKEGWVKIDEVVAGYQFKDARTRDDYDPIYNPDRYVFVQNSSWIQMPNQREENITVFQFLLKNKSQFEMTDIVLLATIKDENSRVLEKKEIPIEGSIPPFASTEVGTLSPEEDAPEDAVGRRMTQSLFNEISDGQPDMIMRWAAGVEVKMSSEDLKEAEIDLLELRAVPREIE